MIFFLTGTTLRSRISMYTCSFVDYWVVFLAGFCRQEYTYKTDLDLAWFMHNHKWNIQIRFLLLLLPFQISQSQKYLPWDHDLYVYGLRLNLVMRRQATTAQNFLTHYDGKLAYAEIFWEQGMSISASEYFHGCTKTCSISCSWLLGFFLRVKLVS